MMLKFSNLIIIILWFLKLLEPGSGGHLHGGKTNQHFYHNGNNMTWASAMGQALGLAFPHLELPTPSSLWTWGILIPVSQNS